MCSCICFIDCVCVGEGGVCACVCDLCVEEVDPLGYENVAVLSYKFYQILERHSI